jgi:flagellar basal-body rod protein FlgB
MATNLSLFTAIGAKMDYLNQRQTIISQNVANADTPGYRPQDLVPVDFSSVLKEISTPAGKMNVSLETTNPQHMPPPNSIADPKAKKQKEVYEVAPVGNAVVMEEQLMHAGQNTMDYTLMSNLYQKHTQMLKTAIGSNR